MIRSEVALTREEHVRLSRAVEDAVKAFSDSLQKSEVLRLYELISKFSEFFSAVGVPRFSERYIPESRSPATPTSFAKVNKIKDDLDELFSRVQSLHSISLEVDSLTTSRRSDTEFLLSQVDDLVGNFELELATDHIVIFSDDFSDDSKVQTRIGIDVGIDRETCTLASDQTVSLNQNVERTTWNISEIPAGVEISDVSYGKMFGVEEFRVGHADAVRHYRTPPVEKIYDVTDYTRIFDSVEDPGGAESVGFIEFEIVELGDVTMQNQYIRDSLGISGMWDEVTFLYSQRPKNIEGVVLTATLLLILKDPVELNSVYVRDKNFLDDFSSAISRIIIHFEDGLALTLIPKSSFQRTFSIPSGRKVVSVTVELTQSTSKPIQHDMRVYSVELQGKKLFRVKDVDLTGVGHIVDSKDE